MSSTMLTRRLLTSSTLNSSLCRAFTTTSSVQRLPTLADIKHDNAAEFDRRQQEFRDASKAAQKAKAEQDSQSAKITAPSTSSSSSPASEATPTTPAESDAKASNSVVADLAHKLSLGSLSTAETDREHTSAVETTKRKGTLANLIYGTKEGQQMDQDIERSFSQVLARGKYVHSIVMHTVKPDRVADYIKLTGDWYPKVAGTKENHVHLVGSWRTEVGDCDTFIHIWEYQRYEGYHASWNSISHNQGFPEFDAALREMITSKNSSLMQEFSFWPTTPPRKLGGLFELRSYTLHPGNLLEWETHWRKGLRARREVMEGVGAWFVQIGDLNTVHHLWQFADLEERKARRELSWGVEGWGETVHKTVPLIQSMKSRILVPMPWSPVA